MKAEKGGTGDVDGLKHMDYSGKSKVAFGLIVSVQLKWKLSWKVSSIFCTHHKT